MHGKFIELTVLLAELHPVSVAAVSESLLPRERNIVWLLVAPEDDDEVLLKVSDAVRGTLTEPMDKDELLIAADGLDTDELVELADDLPHQAVYEALQTRGEEGHEQVEATIPYEGDQVDTIMDLGSVSTRANVVCEVILRYLYRFDSLLDHTDKIFVIDGNDVLQDVLPIRKPLAADPEDMVTDMVAIDVVCFRPKDGVEETTQAFECYDLVTTLVAGENKKLISRIAVDGMVGVIREESETNMLDMVGLQRKEDLFAPIWDSVKNRWMWLAINLCTTFIVSRVVGAPEDSVEKIAALAALMPIVIDTGGNLGNQTVTMIVRVTATG